MAGISLHSYWTVKPKSDTSFSHLETMLFPPCQHSLIYILREMKSIQRYLYSYVTLIGCKYAFISDLGLEIQPALQGLSIKPCECNGAYETVTVMWMRTADEKK